MTDLKPGNTLFDIDKKKGKLIDIGGAFKAKTKTKTELYKIKTKNFYG
jgi:hypothetical protein